MLHTIFPSLEIYALTCAIVFVAQVVYVLFGFGAGMITLGTMALFFPSIQDIVVTLLLIYVPLEISVVATSKAHISWRGVTQLCIGVLVGIPLGTWLLKTGDNRWMLFLLSMVLITIGLAFTLFPHAKAVKWPKWTPPIIGAVAGVLGGLFGAGGSPLVLYYHLTGTPKASFRGNLMAIFLFKSMIKIPVYAFTGLFTLPRLWSALALLPASLLGAWVGHRTHVNISESRFRQGVSLSLILLGILLLRSWGK